MPLLILGALCCKMHRWGEWIMIYNSLQALINYAIDKNIIEKVDIFVVRNRLMNALRLTDWQDVESAEYGDIESILAPIIQYACDNGIIEDTTASKDIFDTEIMGILTPMPREINAEFARRYAISPIEATNWYYDISKDLNYVRALRIAKDLKWPYECEYGTLDITINRSKPEKDPRDIAKAGSTASAKYPKCQLCAENAGFWGTANHPARQNLRPIEITVNDESWQLQYSPYGYYDEHCIAFNTAHVPMKIDDAVFDKMFDIIDYLPHYFVGSNADLPIVGGSILSHEHFQGGNYEFAMAKSEIEYEFSVNGFEKVKAGIVKWPMSVIRVSSADRKELAKCCAHILACWRSYSDADAGIFASTESTPHNTITPISRRRGELYECDLVLRNNRTSDERPLGIFHPNPSLHHIKKENIGLIEVMGLAVLPARLANEIVLIENAILNGSDVSADERIASHSDWVNEIEAKYQSLTSENIRSILEYEIGKVFLEVLCDAGVYKRDENGKQAFLRFVEQL